MLLKPGTKVKLRDVNPDDTGPFHTAEEVEERLREQLKELIKLQNLLYAENRRSLLIVLQGMDTSGKDGTIRHVLSGMSPLGVRVKAFKAPSEDELAHDFFYRVHREVPRHGEIGIFNRSHYEDVLVVRVHDLVPRKVWRERYEQINQFEKILSKNNVLILKFFLHISKSQQKQRLQERLNDPTRYWKFSLQDIEERRFWPDYRKAYETALTRCNTKWAPWHVVPANHKWYRNLVVAETIVQSLSELNMQYPTPATDLSKIEID